MFLTIPVGVDYRANRYPVVTFTLIGLNTLMLFGWYTQPSFDNIGTAQEMQEALKGWWYHQLFLTPADSPWYCWFTAMFTHAGFLHWLGNMIYLFLFGSPVEDMLGRWEFAVFYVLGGLAANLMYIAFTPAHFASTMGLCGASGAISACMGAFALLMFRSKIEFKYILFLFVYFRNGEFLLPTWLVMSFWFLKDLLFAVLSYKLGGTGGGTAFGAHVGGFVCGLGLIALVRLLWQRGWMKRADEGFEAEAEAAPARAAAVAHAIAPVRVQVREKPVTFLSDNGSQSGPFTVAQIRQLVAGGEVSQEAWYWREGMAEWKGVWEITG